MCTIPKRFEPSFSKRTHFSSTFAPPGTIVKYARRVVQQLVDTMRDIWETANANPKLGGHLLPEILGIAASYRRWGNSECSLRLVLNAAREAGADTEFRRLTDFNLLHCRGCLKCVYGEEGCPLEDDLYSLLELCEAADSLVLSAPVYFLSISSTLTTLMDRLLTTDALPDDRSERPAVTINILGNRKWRGVGRGLLNLTASMLGFKVVESLDVVAEGPGDVLMNKVNCSRLAELGAALGTGEELSGRAAPGLCPGCRSDFFRIEPPFIICPVCGYRGDLAEYAAHGAFRDAGSEPRLGRKWLKWHIDDWLRPSAARYMKRRREVLRKMRQLKKESASDER
jgi:multimeric flavodoxin WrbA